jgi:hypothetical protein
MELVYCCESGARIAEVDQNGITQQVLITPKRQKINMHTPKVGN